MKASKFTDAQKAFIINQGEEGTPGGGGAGGCGVTPGAGGLTGAASVGIVLVSSKIQFEGATNLITGARSGDGAAGGLGGASGAGAGGNSGPSINGPSINIVLTSSGSAIAGTPVYYLGRAGSGGKAGIGGTTEGNCTATNGAGASAVLWQRSTQSETVSVMCDDSACAMVDLI